MKLSIDAANASIDAVTSKLSGGALRIYAGVPDQDGTALLAELRWPAPAFPPAKNAMTVSYPLTSSAAISSGNPTFAQAVASDGTVVFDEAVNQGEDSMQIEPAWIEAGGPVVVDHIAYTL